MKGFVFIKKISIFLIVVTIFISTVSCSQQAKVFISEEVESINKEESIDSQENIDNINFESIQKGKLTEDDIENLYLISKGFLNNYYLFNEEENNINLEDYVYNNNFTKHILEKLSADNTWVNKIEELSYELVEFEVRDNYVYFNIATTIDHSKIGGVGGYSESNEMLFTLLEDRIYLVDWYTLNKEGYDMLKRGYVSPVSIDNKNNWND